MTQPEPQPIGDVPVMPFVKAVAAFVFVSCLAAVILEQARRREKQGRGR